MLILNSPLDLVAARRTAEEAWLEITECQSQSQQDFVQGVLDSIPRGAKQLVGLVNGRLAACAVLVPEHDDHVGPCLSVQWNYCMPEFRGQGWWESVYRILIQDAASKKLAAAFTRRVGAGQYLLTYLTYQQVLEKEQELGQKDS